MKLRELRIKNNMSQSELGKKLGVSGQTILNWENGIFEPKINQLIKLADIFDISIDYLVERKNEEKLANEILIELSNISYEKVFEFLKDNIKSKK